MLRRAGRVIFAVLAAALACAAAADVYWHGTLTLVDPSLLGGLAVLATGYLLFGLTTSHDRARDLEGRTDRLTQLTSELEAFITALEAANTRLNASEARYKGLVDAQGDAILRRTPDGRTTYANEGFHRLFGVRPEEAVGQVFRPETHPDSPPPVFGRMAGRETGRERVSYDQHVRTLAGYRWIAWEDYAIRDADGRMVEIQSVGRDITERKILEAALTDARDKAQDANRAKSRFLATMSHEIRTPMNGVLGMGRLLLETPLAPDQKTYADAIQQSGLSLLSLIEDILDFSKIESGALVLEKSDVALKPLIEGIVELLSTRAHAKDIEIVTAIAADVPDTVRTDGIRLRQVLTNLLGNAVKFTEEGGVLIAASVTMHKKADEVQESAILRLEVRDTGIGVPPEKQAVIFEDFVQADSSHARRFEGTGLGLAISKRLTAAMGGDIGVDSAEDQGSVFWVNLPLGEPARLKSVVRPSLAGKRVAIVSDSAILRLGLKFQLTAAGAEVAEARNRDALMRHRRKADLLIIDAAKGEPEPFPDVSQFGIPAIALLPPSEQARLAALAAKGICAYLVKPVRQTSLEQRLLAVLAGEEPLEVAEAEVAVPARSGQEGFASFSPKTIR